MPARIRRDLPHGVRRFRLLPVPHRGVLAQALRADPGGLPLRLQGAGADHLQGLSHARALRPAGGPRERSVSRSPACCSEMFLRPLLPYRSKDGAADLRVRRLRTAQLRGTSASSWTAWTRFWRGLPPGIPLRRGDPQSRSFWSKDYFSCLRSHGVAHVYNAWSKMPELRQQIAIPGFRDRGFPGVPRPAAPRPRVRGCGGDVRSLPRGAGSESRRRANRCGC